MQLSQRLFQLMGVITGIEQQARVKGARTPGRPKSMLKSFALALPEAEDPEPQLSSAKSMRARSQRMSSIATGLLKGLEARNHILRHTPDSPSPILIWIPSSCIPVGQVYSYPGGLPFCGASSGYRQASFAEQVTA